MEVELLTDVIEETRGDFQIPPYFPDSALKNFANEGEAYLLSLNPGCDIKADLNYRSLLKNYVYYAMHHKVDDFKHNYAESILSWQMNTEISSEGVVD